MNINELKSTWENLHGEGLKTHSKNEIRNIINKGTSITVSEINKKIFSGMVVTAIASIISALAVIIFYFLYDPIQYPWINVSKIIPVQLTAFAIFLTLFLHCLAEHKLVNKKFSPDSVQHFIVNVLNGLRKYYLLFNIITMSLLFSAYLMELNYFFTIENQLMFFAHLGLAILLTLISYLVVGLYYQKTFNAYMKDLQSYLEELNG